MLFGPSLRASGRNSRLALIILMENKMKLDKIKFASLIGFISYRYALTVTQDDMREIDSLIDIEACRMD